MLANPNPAFKSASHGRAVGYAGPPGHRISGVEAAAHTLLFLYSWPDDAARRPLRARTAVST